VVAFWAMWFFSLVFRIFGGWFDACGFLSGEARRSAALRNEQWMIRGCAAMQAELGP
jgi:hypothetical protein